MIEFITCFIFVLLFISVITWGVHITMVKGEGCEYGWGTYEQFKREFDKCNWHNGSYGEALVDYDKGGYIHASIYKFNNKGMIMRDPFSYWATCLYIRKHHRIIKPKRNTVNWNNN
jgi:hypothetical protein